MGDNVKDVLEKKNVSSKFKLSIADNQNEKKFPTAFRLTTVLESIQERVLAYWAVMFESRLKLTED